MAARVIRIFFMEASFHVRDKVGARFVVSRRPESTGRDTAD